MSKSITLKDTTFARAEKEAKANGFSDVSEYVSSVLEEIFSAIDEEKSADVDDDDVKKRLRALGYKD